MARTPPDFAYHAATMPSERVQRQIDTLLDQAEEATRSGDWNRVLEFVAGALALDSENEDARSFKLMADKAMSAWTGSAGQPIETDLPDIVASDPSDPSVPTDQPTSFASGRYTVSKLLGEGGKKKVYLAHDNTLDRDVAFALIKTDGLDETGRERVRREAQAMGRMGTHPCIMPIYDLGEEPAEDGTPQPFMVQPLMGGGDVEDLIEDADGPLDLADAIRIATQTAQGLSFAHGKGIVHRDLKPSNIWMDEDGAAKIGDFGEAVATDRSRLTVEKVMVGTVNYMPPEQATGGEVTPRADLYSLGAMLYEMSTGRPPFMGDDDIAIISQHVNTPPVAPSWHNQSMPKTLESLIMRLLAKDPAERPESADEVLTVLQSVDLSAVEESAENKGSLDSMAGGVFVGRQREMDQLKAVFEEVLSGKGRLLTLVGEPGIGKTRTAQELATYAGMRGAQVLWGRSYESGGAPPYWPWLQAIRSHVAATEPRSLRNQMGSTASVIAEVVSDVKEKLPDIPQAVMIEDPESARFRLFDSIATFLKNTASSTPLVLMLEDLHWADKPSLVLLEFVARELANSRILIIGNYRDIELNRRHPLSVTLGDLSRERLFERVVLRGLQKHDVRRFIEIAAGITPPPALVETVFQQTEGNPLFVTETVRLLIQEGDITSGQSSKGGTTSWEIRIPESVREVIGRRLDRLSERCNEVLTIAAVIGRQFQFDVLKILAEDTTDSQLLDAMDEALSARIIEELKEDVGFYQFTHAQMQDTLTQELSHTRAVRMHARIAEALEDYYGDDAEDHAAELAEHFAEAETVLGTKKLIEYHVAAGQQALDSHAYDRAFGYLTSALERHNIKDEMWAKMTALLARAKAATAKRTDLSASAKLYQDAFYWFLQNGDIEDAVKVAIAPFPHFHGTEGMSDMYQQAIAITPKNSSFRGRLLSNLALFKSMELGIIDITAAAEAVAIARADNDNDQLLNALTAQLLAQHMEFSVDETNKILSEVIQLADRSEDLSLKLAAYDYTALHLTSIGLPLEAESVCDNGVQAANRLRSNHALAWAYSNRAQLRSNLGDWHGATDDIRAALAVSPDEPRALVVQIAVANELGDIESLKENAEKLKHTFNFHMMFAGTFAHIYRTHGIDYDMEETLRMVEHSITSVNMEREVKTLRKLQACHLAVSLNDAASASRHFHSIEKHSDTFWNRLGSGYYRVAGLANALMGNPDEAADYYEKSIEFGETSGYRPEMAWTCADYSDFLLDRNAPGDRENATELQDEAIAIATELGMKPLLERVLAKREILKA